jgi:apolipoprotein D and lipocalin family protein
MQRLNVKTLLFFLLAVTCLFLSACSPQKKIPGLTPAKEVDIDKYTGLWYEIARYPNRFEANCRCVTAEYTHEEHHMLVRNSCLRGSSTTFSVQEGKAWPIPESNNSKWKIQFFWPFRGRYWVIYVDIRYQYAIVSDPGRKNLWILARKPIIPEPVMTKLIDIAKSQYFNTDKLIKTDQSCELDALGDDQDL